MVRIGVPGRLQPAQALDPAKLGVEQRDKVVPATERLVVGVAVMTIHKRVEPAPRDRLEKVAKDAIAVAHARSFLSLDNQKVAGSSRFGRACTRVISNRSPDIPAEAAAGGRSHCPLGGPRFRVERRPRWAAASRVPAGVLGANAGTMTDPYHGPARSTVSERNSCGNA
jgi:hypothetical protein